MRLIIALCLLALAVAAPPPVVNYPNYDAQLLRYENDNIGLGNYYYAYEQSDGQKAQAQGQLKNEGREDESISVSGTYSWVGPDGVTYTVKYIADDNGYQPEIEEGPGGAIPSAVLASLVG